MANSICYVICVVDTLLTLLETGTFEAIGIERCAKFTFVGKEVDIISWSITFYAIVFV